jgi:predicted ABC-type ATPase
MRADADGHSAPVPVLRTIYESSIGNLPRAIREIDFVYVYDNSGWGVTPKVLLQAGNGEVVYLAEQIPDWLARTLGR